MQSIKKTLYMKPRILILALLLASQFIIAQNSLTFDKKFVQSEDKWVAFPMAKDSTYMFGFIYIDQEAGLTFDLEGDFKINSNGKFITSGNKKESSIKTRLQPNNMLIAFIPESKFSELNISKTPEWLQAYKTNENSIERLYNWGYMYNGWNECEKALVYLEKAKNINQNYKGLNVELAFSYNCLKRYQDAILVLQKAIESNPTDSYTNKELIYAEVKSGQIDLAIKSFKRALEICKDETYNAENSFQILQAYFLQKDVINFEKWLSENHNLLYKNQTLPPIIEQMITLIKK
jgi:tetratricopeptide (TPR) repeat protein